MNDPVGRWSQATEKMIADTAAMGDKLREECRAAGDGTKRITITATVRDLLCQVANYWSKAAVANKDMGSDGLAQVYAADAKLVREIADGCQAGPNEIDLDRFILSETARGLSVAFRFDHGLMGVQVVCSRIRRPGDNPETHAELIPLKDFQSGKSKLVEAVIDRAREELCPKLLWRSMTMFTNEDGTPVTIEENT